MKPTFVDMFAGAGLFSAGFIQAGFRPVLAIELDREAAASYRLNVADCVVQGSVATYSVIPQADVLIAGPPCQGFSTLGRRDPQDTRNDLCLQVPKWAEQVKPSVVLVENVPPFIKSRQWKRMVRAFRKLGYDVDVWELNATDHGVAQLRQRSFTVASKIGQILPPRPNPRRKRAGEVIASGISRSDPMHFWPIPRGVAAERIALIPPGGDKRDIARVAPHLCPPSWAKMGCQATDAWGRIFPDAPANTIRCTFQNPSKGRYLHPFENRVLSLREGARLQGVPDRWLFIGRPYPVARQIGNGVPVPLARAVGRAVARAFY